MITIEEILEIHEAQIKEFGGSFGLRDKHGLEAAIARPFQTFGNTELYPTAIEKAAAISESHIKNHPFVDGNKRIGYVLLRFLLLENGFDINASKSEKYDFVIKMASGQLDKEQIQQWIKNNIIKLK